MLQNILQNICKTKHAKSKKIQKHPSNLENIFKSAKNNLEKLTTKEDSSKTTISKVLNKIPNRKKISKQQYNFFKAKISLEVHGM